MRVAGEEVRFATPRAAIAAGIAAVYQDLAVVGQMSVWRNFFLGQKLTGFRGKLKEEEGNSKSEVSKEGRAAVVHCICATADTGASQETSFLPSMTFSTERYTKVESTTNPWNTDEPWGHWKETCSTR
ncbi:L-arabinose transporter ATP-binding protein [Corynebacterium occultum]|uniref:L-arabinose transporter ATP-binding protein n=1 Tax=Corynebacterium occultum TaxID=2675219 RepID=A0A6B8WAL4_9CORY|nr:L-arabinose transporter ATP-binding protein [Corynebacterium occultum]